MHHVLIKEKEFFFKKTKERKENEVAQLCPTVCNPMDCSLPGSSVHGIFHGVGYHFLLQGGLPAPGIKPESPTLQAEALWSEPPGWYYL